MKRPAGFDDGHLDEPTPTPEPAPVRTPETASVPAPAPVPGPQPEPGPISPVVSADSERQELDPVEEQGPDTRVRHAERALERARRQVRRRERRETRRFTAHVRRRRRNLLIAIGAVLALAAFVAVGTLSPLTAVREVTISGASRVDVAEIQTALERFDGVPLTLVSDREVHRALEPFPLIQRYSVERIPPHTLVVRIEEREPVVAIEDDGRYRLLDPAGVLVATADDPPTGVPRAEGAAADPASPAFAAAGTIVRDLPEDLRKRLVGVAATSAQDVEFILDGGLRVVWGEAADTQFKAVVLRAMLKAAKNASSIDVSAPDAPVFE